MFWIYVHYKCFTLSVQGLSLDVRIWRPKAVPALLPDTYKNPEDLFKNAFKTESPENLQNLAIFIIISETRNFQILVNKIYEPIARQVVIHKSALVTGVLCWYLVLCTVVNILFYVAHPLPPPPYSCNPVYCKHIVTFVKRINSTWLDLLSVAGRVCRRYWRRNWADAEGPPPAA